MENLTLPIVVALLVILITIILYKRFKTKSKLVVLTGLSDSGKTALFTKIVFNKPKSSVTSLKENQATIDRFNVEIVDLPGADRLRNRYWEQYRLRAGHVVFVLDASTIEDKLRDVSEYLYFLLSDGLIHRNAIRFTVACNKQDLDGALKKDDVKTLLEKELNAIRNTKKGQLGKTSNEEVEDFLDRLESKAITLDALRVNFIETNIGNTDHLIKIIF